MQQKIARIALVVSDYDEAIAFYTQKLKFDLLEDTVMSATKRWVVVAPKGATETALLLAKAANDEQMAFVGNQSGGRVFLFLYTDDLKRDYQNLLAQNVKIVRNPETHDYGKVLVFADLYGNLWDLIEEKGK
jgi:catechol 2,3-dioxygenase-like lactoylglutathione lyase family enzyme